MIVKIAMNIIWFEREVKSRRGRQRKPIMRENDAFLIESMRRI